jgi:hypothetical protein
MDNDHGMCHTFVLVLLGQMQRQNIGLALGPGGKANVKNVRLIYSFEQRDKRHFMQAREGLPMAMPMHMAMTT